MFQPYRMIYHLVQYCFVRSRDMFPSMTYTHCCTTPTVIDQPGCGIRSINILSIGRTIYITSWDSQMFGFIYSWYDILVAAYMLLHCLGSYHPPFKPPLRVLHQSPSSHQSPCGVQSLLRIYLRSCECAMAWHPSRRRDRSLRETGPQSLDTWRTRGRSWRCRIHQR